MVRSLNFKVSACVCIGMEGTFNLRKSTLWPVTCKVQVVHMVLGQMGGTLVCMRRQGAEGGGVMSHVHKFGWKPTMRT